jgi:hypothetical protein
MNKTLEFARVGFFRAHTHLGLVSCLLFTVHTTSVSYKFKSDVEELYSEVTLFLFFNHTEGVFWDIALFVPMMEAVSTSETSINLYETARYRIPED